MSDDGPPVLDWQDMRIRLDTANDVVRMQEIQIERLREQVVELHGENISLKKKLKQKRRSMLYALFDWTPHKQT